MNNARAMAMRCFCPPDKVQPRSPIFLEKKSNEMSSYINAVFAAWTTRSYTSLGILLSFRPPPSFMNSPEPYTMLSKIVPENNTGSCDTIEITRFRNHFEDNSLIFIPSNLIAPASTL
mmetsp:Transcript_7344/g.22218  ORF Transcript_7344/g.22218 Transcript_7344/m.22218 type:complete len:118 (+) Transcript_7344:169-522(+)